MLVLTRKVNEEILVDENIRIQVIEVRGNRVRIGITAPDHVRILRSELQPNDDILGQRTQAYIKEPTSTLRLSHVG